jgi:hypothetical protein
MTNIELHPEFLTSNGERQFAVLPYAEYLALREFLEDVEDLFDLREARESDKGDRSLSIDNAERELGLS